MSKKSKQLETFLELIKALYFLRSAFTALTAICFFCLNSELSAIVVKKKEYNFAVNKVYANALFLAHKKSKLEHFLNYEILKETDLQYINKYIKIAKEYNLPKVVNRAYRQILVFFPDNLEAFKNVGENAFYNQDYSTAAYYLERYDMKTGGDYLTHYMYGEILFNYGHYLCASDYFKKSLSELDKKEINQITVQDNVVKANLLYRLEQPHKATVLYKKTVEANPNDLFLKLDYIDFLLTLNHTYTAAKLLKEISLNRTSKKRIMAFTRSPYTPMEKERIDQDTELLKVRLYQKNGQLNEAFNTLNKLKEKYNKINTARYHLAKADTLAMQGDILGESYSLDNIMELQPENDVILRRLEQKEKEIGSFFAVNGGFLMGKDRDNNASYQYLITETLNIRINKYLSVGGIYQQDLISSKNIQQLGGKTGAYTGLKQRNEFYSIFDIPSNDYMNPSTLKLSYYLGNEYNIAENSGFGFNYNYLDKWGSTDVFLDLKKPYWELPSAVVEGGNKSRVGIAREFKVIPNLYIYTMASYNRYGVQNEAFVGQSMQFGVNATYNLPVIELQEKLLGSNSRFALNYEMDAEFYSDLKQKVNSAGESYDVLQLVNRQVNSFYLSFTKEFTDDFNFSVYGGYSIDTVGEKYHGAIFGGRIFYRIFDCLEAEAVAYHNIGIITSTYAGIGLKWYFVNCLKNMNRSWL